MTNIRGDGGIGCFVSDFRIVLMLLFNADRLVRRGLLQGNRGIRTRSWVELGVRAGFVNGRTTCDMEDRQEDNNAYAVIK